MMDNKTQELEELDSKIGLIKAGYTQISKFPIFAKGKEIHAQCTDCGFWKQVPFNSIRGKSIVYTCQCLGDALISFKYPLNLLKW